MEATASEEAQEEAEDAAGFRIHVIAHPAAIALALFLRRWRMHDPIRRSVVEIFAPASEHDMRGVSELRRSRPSACFRSRTFPVPFSMRRASASTCWRVMARKRRPRSKTPSCALSGTWLPCAGLLDPERRLSPPVPGGVETLRVPVPQDVLGIALPLGGQCDPVGFGHRPR